MKADFTIIGGGIIGLSTAWQLQQRHPSKKVLVLEKEGSLGHHQTGHNSGVIHSGIYYSPGSLKARFCRQGLADTISFCKRHRIRHDQCGKLLVATDDAEHTRMLALHEQSRENRVECELLETAQLREMEPRIIGTGALLVRETGIVDYREVCKAMLVEFQGLGGTVMLNCKVSAIRENDSGVSLSTTQGVVTTGFLVACAGLQADRLAAMHGLNIDFRIVPFRGEYYRLAARLSGIISRLIYPIPDPELPFLGIHLTRMINGDITVGPNAVPGWKREGYGRFNFNAADTLDMITFPGYWKVMAANLRSGVSELVNSVWRPAYLRQVRKYCPAITLADLLPHPAGVRAQAVRADGSLVQDFLFVESGRAVHVGNAPSPAATSAFPIGAYICDRIAAKLAR
jgi:L-2-hydroxyglutarate oxidase